MAVLPGCVMRADYPHIEALLYSYGRWRNRDLGGGRPGGSAMHTPGAHDDQRSYWQVCQPCYGTGADLSEAGSGLKSRSSLYELAKTHTCPSCRGRRGHSEVAALADPAAIPRTGPGGMHVLMDDTPQEFLDIEAALDSLDEHNARYGRGPRARAVIEARYVHYPRSSARQDPEDRYGQKARVAWCNQRLAPDRVSGKMYGYLLTATKRRLADALGVQTKRDLEDEERRVIG